MLLYLKLVSQTFFLIYHVLFFYLSLHWQFHFSITHIRHIDISLFVIFTRYLCFLFLQTVVFISMFAKFIFTFALCTLYSTPYSPYSSSELSPNSSLRLSYSSYSYFHHIRHIYRYIHRYIISLFISIFALIISLFAIFSVFAIFNLIFATKSTISIFLCFIFNPKSRLFRN